MPQVPRSLGSAIFAMRPTKKRQCPSDWPEWFEPKGYLHFDQPIRQPDQIRKVVESDAEVERHAFLPFIHFQKIARKYKRDKGGFVKKPRSLSYASHVDSQIFRRYCLILMEHYEQLIASLGISDSVLAYRRRDPPKCNIHFANEAFLFVEKHAPCVAMAFDVQDFFESLNHKLLKQRWKQVLGLAKLPADHYAVFSTVTRYAWVNRASLFQLFGITKKKLAHLRGPICTPQQFREKVATSDPKKGLIKVKNGSSD